MAAGLSLSQLPGRLYTTAPAPFFASSSRRAGMTYLANNSMERMIFLCSRPPMRIWCMKLVAPASCM